MALDGYSGLPGSGKSHSVVKHLIVPALKKGREVWTNIPVHEEAMLEHTGSLPTQVDITDIIGIKDTGWTKQKPVWKKAPNDRWFLDVFPAGGVLVLDEAWKIWPAGLKLTDIPEEHKEFIAMHRHLVNEEGDTTSIAIVSQDLKKIAAGIRGDIATTFRTRKLEMIGKKNSYMVDVYEGAAEGNRPAKSTFLRHDGPFTYDPEIYKLYKSSTMSQSGDVGEEDRIDDRKNILKSGGMKFMGAAVVVLLILAGLGIMNTVTGFQELTEGGEVDELLKTDVPGTSEVNQEPVKRKEILAEPDPFADHELWIGSNNGIFPRIDYVILADGPNETQLRLKPNMLRAMGYKVQYIDQCTIMARRIERVHWISCRQPEIYDDNNNEGGILDPIAAF